MRRLVTARHAVRPRVVMAMVATLAAAGPLPSARAIEMFTYFGDGSRIGLPSLEVPIEAYPGIPLRSDRIRARNRALMMRRGTQPSQAAGQAGTKQPARGITIRTMPVGEGAPEEIPVAPEPQ